MAARLVPDSRTPHSAGRRKKYRRIHGESTPVREQTARILRYDEYNGAGDTLEHGVNKEELVEAATRQKRLAAGLIERLSVELGK